jgi:cytochrome o ubiquinol oxidase operon protein cyoD
LIGFGLSLLLTSLSFLLVHFRVLDGRYLIYTVVALAVVQAIVQSLCFLHVGQEPKPRWESLIYAFMVLIMLVIVLGSLWIMFDLDYRMMPMDMHGASHD